MLIFSELWMFSTSDKVTRARCKYRRTSFYSDVYTFLFSCVLRHSQISTRLSIVLCILLFSSVPPKILIFLSTINVILSSTTLRRTNTNRSLYSLCRSLYSLFCPRFSQTPTRLSALKDWLLLCPPQTSESHKVTNTCTEISIFQARLTKLRNVHFSVIIDEM